MVFAAAMLHSTDHSILRAQKFFAGYAVNQLQDQQVEVVGHLWCIIHKITSISAV